ncbi:DNA repair protein RecN [Limobrevibacterium gyesilva]|uniref:DNA repair protein RecN n=1 Tax=Limobrevibacterium gyesilva TaxID=2991712 RepID=A0AA42CHU0_9PROT|nr:DNA repair protein RecN [Limobrevibacterium gyesilva]MCW3477616.1 DNA repair protein RecN [Limobrevibacterium gyesilva]
MLTALSIRDVVLIERLDLSFGPGLTVLTGETGAGKSILLDSLGLAMGARSEAGLVRAGAEQASVAAVFAPPAGHPVYTLLAEQGIAADDEIVLRRVVAKDGRSRAFANDQPVGAALLKRAAGLLAEVQGQHDQMGLADPAGHALLLDAFGVPDGLRAAVAAGHRAWRAAAAALEAAREAIAEAERDQEWLRHAVDELARLAPEDGEEERLAAERQRLQQGERRAAAIATALGELSSRDRRNPGPAASLRAAARALQRLTPANDPDAANPAAPAMAALERAEEALAEAETLLTRLADEAEADPRLLEAAEERLFALRAAARKHGLQVMELPALLATLRDRLAALETGSARVEELEREAAATRASYAEACSRLSEARRAAAAKLDRAVARELPPLRLERARFVTDMSPLPESDWGAQGADAVRFLIATNPGQAPGPLAKIASGGELSRLMLALKVVLAGGSPVPTLVFDEVDSGIGGATAAAVGERLTRVAQRVQVLLVTHSPQVAARGAAHLRVAKTVAKGRAATHVQHLDGPERREEIARMLAGETVTAAARAAAESLLGPA